MLRGNVQLNSVRVDVRQKAFGRQVAILPFYAPRDHDIPSSSSLDERFMVSAGLPLERVNVDVSTLDDENIPSGKSLLKIDTETTEPDVIAGANKFLARSPVIFVEVIDSGERLRAALSDYPHDAFLLTGDGPVKHPKIQCNSKWRNWLLLPTCPGPWR